MLFRLNFQRLIRYLQIRQPSSYISRIRRGVI
uniref:Uncharacterized protein n=1 Tax=Podoviridae sp. ctLPy3 TaxID=2825244 RepID=A0A8S5UWL6_9CAUD|nr:MAG TPA: hypothetical protein [Podoviridae sp. ctLPy3]DAR20992.1 MAG TPA: hypothetical protein [Caudoviricetes sp.]